MAQNITFYDKGNNTIIIQNQSNHDTIARWIFISKIYSYTFEFTKISPRDEKSASYEPSTMKFKIAVTFPHTDKTLNVRFYGEIGILYDWREHTNARPHRAFTTNKL